MRHKMNLRNRTDAILKYIFKPIDIIALPTTTDYVPNRIRMTNIALIGSQSSGKTELARSITEKAVQFYGKNRVNAIFSEDGDLASAMASLDESLVQLIFCDNFTMKKVGSDQIRNYFQLRQRWIENLDRNFGYILTLFGLHRYHSTSPEFKDNIHGAIFKSAPPKAGKYSSTVAKDFIGNGGLEDLQYISSMCEIDPEFMKYSVFGTRDSSLAGILKMDMAKTNYLKSINIGVSSMTPDVPYNRVTAGLRSNTDLKETRKNKQDDFWWLK